MFKSSRLKKVSNAFKSSSSASQLEENKIDGRNNDSKFLSNTFKSPSSILHSSKSPLSSPKTFSSSFKAAVPSGSESKLFESKVSATQGVKGRIIALAFDFSQSLLAAATNTNEIHIFGKKQIEVVFTLESKASIIEMKFIKGIYLVVIDAKDTVTVLSLLSKTILATMFAPSKITCVESDPSLDWLLLGLQSGSVMIYDVDRNQVSNLKIENLQKSQFFPKEHLSPVVSITWNPRDVGSILISYELVSVVYSFVEQEIKQSFIYELPPYSPGGDFSRNIDRKRTPKTIQSLYHPNSLHILTIHEDNSLVFWDANSGKLIQARSLNETDIHLPQDGTENKSPSLDTPQIHKVFWVTQSNPEYTSLIITSRPSVVGSLHGITIMDLGGTPLYSITSYDAMSKYYSSPKKEKLCPLINKAPIKSILPIPRSSPYFSGGHDPLFTLVLLEDGEIETLLTTSGLFTSQSSLLPQSLSWARPTATTSHAIAVPKKLWLGMMTTNSGNSSLLQGGTSSKKPLKVHDIRSAIVTGHSNGSVRLWDSALAELEDSSVFEVNLGRILNRGDKLAISDISFGAETLELATSTENGEVVLFKYEVNQYFNANQAGDNNLDMEFSRFSIDNSKDILINVKNRSPRNIRQGFVPSTVVHARRGKVTALKNSNIGFVGIAYQDGTIMIIDRRGPAIIFMENLKNIPKLRSTYVTSINFSIMEFGEDGYSSILMLCGTDAGELITNKILPENGGRFCAQYVDSIKSNDNGPIIGIETVAKDTGYNCEATIAKMQDLTKGLRIPGYALVTGNCEIRSVKIGKSKESNKSFKYPIASSGIVYTTSVSNKDDQRIVTYLVAYLVNGGIKVLSVPDLKEVKSLQSPIPIHSRYVMESSVLRNGEIFVRTDQFMSVIISITNKQVSGVQTSDETDTLYNQNLRIPYRPQVNSLQWARGTVYCTSEQLDQILGGERRQDSKYKESAIAKGTLVTKPNEKQDKTTELHYQKPVRHGARGSRYGMLRDMSRAVETSWDAVEDQFNDAAAAMGQGMNDAMEQTGKDIVRGSFGF